MTMTVAILGAAGQLGRALARRLPLQGYAVIPLTRPEWDVTDADIVSRLVGLRPSALVNAAAMTHVDGCEHEPERAYGVNGLGAEHVDRHQEEEGAAGDPEGSDGEAEEVQDRLARRGEDREGDGHRRARDDRGAPALGGRAGAGHREVHRHEAEGIGHREHGGERDEDLAEHAAGIALSEGRREMRRKARR